MSIYRGAGGSGDAVADSSSEALLIRDLAIEVQADADAAAASASDAATSESNTATSATNASNSASAAATSATNAASSATSASSSATSAASSATSATSSKNAAATSATNAANSASAASTSATNAASSATSASNSASAASTSATNAASSASSASTSATNASSSASSAATSASNAAASYDSFDDRYLGSKSSAPTLDNDGNALLTGALYFNSVANDMYVWTGSAWVTVSNTTSSTSAANSATAAATSASNAATSETNAASSATSASTSASTATTQASNASTSATNAANSATSAATSATNAASSATAAANSATSASASAAAASAVALGNEPVRHSVRPSLLLDFANTKTLDPRITFTRGSTGTYYDGKTTVKAEENLFQYSQEFDNAYWGKASVSITSNSSTAPDGTTTAETMTADGTTNQHYIFGTDVVGAKTLSIFAKAGTNNFIQIAVGGDASVYANFDLSGATSNAYGTGTTSSITSVGNGWYRCVMVSTNTAITGVRYAVVSSVSAARLESNSLSTNVLIWAAQSELRQSVTAYTATTTAPITNYIPALQTAASGVARFEHNPVTGESLGLEIEEQRTNLLLRSEEFDNASWTKYQVTISQNSIVSPDGTLDADKMVEDTTASSAHAVGQSMSFTSGTSYTASIYAKAGERNRLYLYPSNTTTFSAGAIFDLSTGTIAITYNGTATITSVGNGWYRCSITGTAGATASTNVNVRLVQTGTTTTYTGDGYSGIYIWGAQLEAGAFPTSYIPTVASQVTRSADSASMTGTNFSSWYNYAEGTVYSEIVPQVSTSCTVLGIDSGVSTAQDALLIFTSGSNLFARLRSPSTTGVFSASLGTLTANSPAKVIFSMKTNDFAGTINSGTLAAASSGPVLPSASRLFIGRNSDANAYTNGTIKKLAYYPKRLTNAELQGLTTV